MERVERGDPRLDQPSQGTIVMVTGAVPGLGKSTLCERLTEALASRGHKVEHFREDDILTREEFDRVIASFRSTGFASRDQLLEATTRYLDRCAQERADHVVQDMLLPYLPSLLAWGHGDSDIAAFFEDLARLTHDFRLLELHLEGDPEESVARAARREGDGWVDASIHKFSGYDTPEPIVDLASLLQYFAHMQERSRRLLKHAPWTVIHLDSGLGVDRVLEAAIRAIEHAAP